MSNLVLRKIGDDKLQHYGVKGMKWGVRRANPSGATVSAKAKMEKARTTYKKKSAAKNQEYDEQMRKVKFKQALGDAITGGEVRKSLAGRISADMAATAGDKYKKLSKDADKARAEYKAAKKEYKTAKKADKDTAKAVEKAAKATKKWEKSMSKGATAKLMQKMAQDPDVTVAIKKAQSKTNPNLSPQENNFRVQKEVTKTLNKKLASLPEATSPDGKKQVQVQLVGVFGETFINPTVVDKN